VGGRGSGSKDWLRVWVLLRVTELHVGQLIAFWAIDNAHMGRPLVRENLHEIRIKPGAFGGSRYSSERVGNTSVLGLTVSLRELADHRFKPCLMGNGGITLYGKHRFTSLPWQCTAHLNLGTQRARCIEHGRPGREIKVN